MNIANTDIAEAYPARTAKPILIVFMAVCADTMPAKLQSVRIFRKERLVMNYKEKIKTEVAVNSKDRRVEAIKNCVAKELLKFCEQEPEFAQAVEQSDKTVIDCCKACLDGVGGSVSDLEVYSKAVKFYFQTATLDVIIRVNLCGNTGTPPITMTTSSSADTEEEKKEEKDSFNLFLDNLLDF